MESFLRRVCEGRIEQSARKYFLRFGKGKYDARFILCLNVGTKLKLKGSFEWANDFVKFAEELGADKFTGKVLSKDAVSGYTGRKKAGVMVYDVEDVSLKGFTNAYYTLVDCEMPDFKLRIKKALPKPGKDSEKVDDGFCLMELDLKYLNKVRDTFLWDIPDGKKIEVKNTLDINQIIFPAGEKDPVKIREKAIRKGKLIRRAVIDTKEFTKEYPFEV